MSSIIVSHAEEFIISPAPRLGISTGRLHLHVVYVPESLLWPANAYQRLTGALFAPDVNCQRASASGNWVGNCQP